jgi:hypothetical protein
MVAYVWWGDRQSIPRGNARSDQSTDTVQRSRGAAVNAANRYELMAAVVTLNGRPATISGARQPFALVRDDDGRSYEWSWSTVQRVVANGGDFKS